MKKIGLPYSVLVFGSAAIALFIETRFLIPYLSKQTGLEPIIFWIIVGGLGIFFPMLIFSFFILKSEGLRIGKDTWRHRLRFKMMNKSDWQWCAGSIIVMGILSLLIIKILELLIGKVESQPPFMYFEPLTPNRYWILLIWFPYWLLNIMGEEILWRGVILPRQELAFGKNTWLIHGFFWGIFHIPFGWHILVTVIPVLFILSYVVQHRKNSWIGVVIHAVINGPSFIAISFGLV